PAVGHAAIEERGGAVRVVLAARHAGEGAALLRAVRTDAAVVAGRQAHHAGVRGRVAMLPARVVTVAVGDALDAGAAVDLAAAAAASTAARSDERGGRQRGEEETGTEATESEEGGHVLHVRAERGPCERVFQVGENADRVTRYSRPHAALPEAVLGRPHRRLG